MTILHYTSKYLVAIALNVLKRNKCIWFSVASWSLWIIIYMLTLTYNQDHLPEIYIDSHLSLSGEIKLNFADSKHIQDMFKRLRKLHGFPVKKYIAVSEFGGERHRPHWHLLLFVPKFDSDDEYEPLRIESYLYELFKTEWRINVGSNRKPKYEPLFTFHKNRT